MIHVVLVEHKYHKYVLAVRVVGALRKGEDIFHVCGYKKSKSGPD